MSEDSPKFANVERKKLNEIVEKLPHQNPLIRFQISEQNKIELVKPVDEQNDFDTINALRDELIAEEGPIALLLKRFATSPNIPQFGLFGPIAQSYQKELSKKPHDINFAILYARGARFYSARMNADRQVSAGEWPELDVEDSEAINAICDLHGPLIMASHAGRQIIASAHEYETTPERYREDQAAIEEFGRAIAAEQELVESPTASVVRELTSAPENDPQPARSRGLGLMVVSSGLVVFVGGAALYAVGGASLAYTVPIAISGIATAYGWEVVKKSKRFRTSTDEHAELLDGAIAGVEVQSGYIEQALLGRMATFVANRRELFLRVANLRPEFSWAKKFLPADENAIDESATIDPDHPTETGVFSPFSSPVKALDAYAMSCGLAREWTKDNWLRNIANKRVMADLKKLGLIHYPTRESVQLTTADVDDPQGMFKNALAKQESIQLTRQALIQNPQATAYEICDLVTSKLGKKFATESTKLREGNALIRWTRWLEPYLIDPSDSRADILRASAKSTSGARGRVRMKTPENLKIVSDILLSGGTRRDAAKKVGTTTGAISNWIAEGIVPGVASNSTGMRPKTVEVRKLATKRLIEGATYEEVEAETGYQANTIRKWVREGTISLD